MCFLNVHEKIWLCWLLLITEIRSALLFSIYSWRQIAFLWSISLWSIAIFSLREFRNWHKPWFFNYNKIRKHILGLRKDEILNLFGKWLREKLSCSMLYWINFSFGSRTNESGMIKVLTSNVAQDYSKNIQNCNHKTKKTTETSGRASVY